MSNLFIIPGIFTWSAITKLQFLLSVQDLTATLFQNIIHIRHCLEYLTNVLFHVALEGTACFKTHASGNSQHKKTRTQKNSGVRIPDLPLIKPELTHLTVASK